ncbi:MAG: 6,7-dimethyl-8-ribityllumazine synthase [Mariprofundaceae bacterium]|nr:6,7-dimethyl-8-ribityllumazine synthase [Mariprofundaceae bacterium]
MSLDAPHLAGSVDATGMKIGIIVSRFNADITEGLLDGALKALKEHGATDQMITIIHVPGALEIPTIASAMAQTGRYAALVCLGCVIKGDTAHFDHVCRVAMDSIGHIAECGDIAIANGILTVDTHAQAVDRIGGAHGHKGAEAALTAVEIAALLDVIEGIEGIGEQT